VNTKQTSYLWLTQPLNFTSNYKINNMKVIYLVFSTCLLTLSSLAQVADTVGHDSSLLIDEYEGGRFGFSGLYLSLYSDSTYVYSGWYDSGGSFVDKEVFIRKDSTINLCSFGYLNKTDKRYDNNFLTFKSKTYRLRGEKILIYSKRQEKSRNSDFYIAYKTLYKKTKK
jgi:hypothetical protein